MAIWAGAIAVAAALLFGCSDPGSTSSSTAGATCPKGTTIAYMGRFDETGSAPTSPTQLGTQLAVDEFNRANPKCQVALEVEAGSGADAAAPAAAAKKIVANPQVLAAVGPYRSGDVETAGPVLEAGGVPFVSATATRTDLSAQGWKMFHRVVGTNKTLGSAAAQYLTNTLHASKVAVIDDGTPYAADLASTVSSALGTRATVVKTITKDPASVAAAVASLSGLGPNDAVYFAGYELPAADLLRQMRAAGITSTFVGSDTLLSTTFLDAAGKDGAGVITTCLCTPPSELPAGEDFSKRFRASFPDSDPSQEYAAESFDATNLILATIAAGNHDRSSIAKALATTTWNGITRTIQFDKNGEVVDPVVWVSKVSGRSFVPIGSVTTN